MKFTVNQHHDTSVSIMTDMGYVLGYFSSVDEAIDICNEWYSTNSKEHKFDVKINQLEQAQSSSPLLSYFGI